MAKHEKRRLTQWAFLLAATLRMSAGFASAVDTVVSEPACKSVPEASVQLELRENGGLLIPVSIQNTPAYMILSLGAPLSTISRRAVTKLSLPAIRYSDSAILANGEKAKNYVQISNLAVGEIHFPEQDLMIDPASDEPGRYPTPDIVGTLGMDLLWRSDVEMDLAHKKMNLYRPGTCRGHVVYWADHFDMVPLHRSPYGDFYFPMRLDGRTLEAAFSTGNSATTLRTDVAKRVYGFDRSSAEVESAKLPDGRTMQFRTMQLAAAALKLTDERVFLLDASNQCVLARKADGIGYENCFGAYPLMLGASVLSKLHVYIATAENLLYFTVND